MSLDFFTAANCPEGATERCVDGCTVPDCPFRAPNFYLSELNNWSTRVLKPNPTEENIMEALRTTDYGRCVFKMDNDVVDHQVVSLLMEDGITITFQMNGFNAEGDRFICIMGTEGEIWGNFGKNLVYHQRFGKERHCVNVTKLASVDSAYGGGDEGIIHDVIRFIRGDDFDTGSTTAISRSVESHYMALPPKSPVLKMAIW